MSSESEQELLDEISYLTGLIQSHQSNTSRETVTVATTFTSAQSSRQVYAYRSNPRDVPKPKSKAVHAAKDVPKAQKVVPAANLHKQYSSERTRQGNLVYRPGEAVQSEGTDLKVSTRSTSHNVVGRSKGNVGQNKSYFGNSQQVSYAGVSTCTSVATATTKSKSRAVVNDGSRSASLTSHRTVVQSNAGSKLPATSLSIPSGMQANEGASSTARSLSFKDEAHRAGKRRRSSSKSGDGKIHTPAKRHKHIPSGLKSGKYVWTAQSLSHKTSPKVSPASQLPKRCQLKWKRKSLDKKVRASAQSPTTPTAACKSPTTKKTPKMTTVSRYKWRRRLSSSGNKKLLRVPNPTLVIQSKYKMMHSSLLRKYPTWSPRKRLGSFTHRQLNYLSKRSHATAVHRQASNSKASKMKSKNRVWVSDSRHASDTEAPSSDVINRRVGVASLKLVGYEARTKRGNKQWVAGGRVNVRTVQKSPGQHTRRRLVSLRGHKFLVDSSGKRLQRLPSSTALSSTSDVSKAASATRLLASRAIRRSKAFVWHAKQRSKQQKTQQYCTFFNRFGKCNRGDTCPYIHDPDRVAICTKFLRGICDKTDGTCPFSHKISKEKMPVCSFFLRGVCARDACPYLHVSVGRDAEVCPDFLTGYCPKGEQCIKLHPLDCPDFSKTGSCPRGKGCPLRHQKRKPRGIPRTEADKSTVVKEPVAFKRVHYKQSSQKPPISSPVGNGDSKLITPAQLEFIPLEQNNTPDFIALQ